MEVSVAPTGILSTNTLVGDSPTRPLPLVHGQISKWGVTDAETRLVYEEPENAVLNGLWYLEFRHSSIEDWTRGYCFALFEFTPQDFEVMSYSTSTRSSVWFTYEIVCMKMILDEEKDDITGAVILVGSHLKRRTFDKGITLVECRSEDQRVAVLSEYFGINLSKRERTGIKGLVTELKAGSKSGL